MKFILSSLTVFSATAFGNQVQHWSNSHCGEGSIPATSLFSVDVEEYKLEYNAPRIETCKILCENAYDCSLFLVPKNFGGCQFYESCTIASNTYEHTISMVLAIDENDEKIDPLDEILENSEENLEDDAYVTSTSSSNNIYDFSEDFLKSFDERYKEKKMMAMKNEYKVVNNIDCRGRSNVEINGSRFLEASYETCKTACDSSSQCSGFGYVKRGQKSSGGIGGRRGNGGCFFRTGKLKVRRRDRNRYCYIKKGSTGSKPPTTSKPRPRPPTLPKPPTLPPISKPKPPTLPPISKPKPPVTPKPKPKPPTLPPVTSKPKPPTLPPIPKPKPPVTPKPNPPTLPPISKPKPPVSPKPNPPTLPPISKPKPPVTTKPKSPVTSKPRPPTGGDKSAFSFRSPAGYTKTLDLNFHSKRSAKDQIKDSKLDRQIEDGTPRGDRKGDRLQIKYDADLGKDVIEVRMYKNDIDGAGGKKDRQRTEFKGSPSERSPSEITGKPGDSLVYIFWFKLSEDYTATKRFSHFFQLKTVGKRKGYPGTPLHTLSVRGENGKGTIDFHVAFSNRHELMDINKARGQWIQARIAVSYGKRGSYEVNLKDINGKDLGSARGSKDTESRWAPVSHTRIKMGIYRGLKYQRQFEDLDTVRFSDITIYKK